MAQNLLNYEGLGYFLEQLKTYIESLRTVKNVDTTESNGINLSNTNGTLDVTVTPGSVADGDTGLVTGDAVYDAIQAGKAVEVKLTATANPNLYTTSMPPATISYFINSGKDVYILMTEGVITLVYKAYNGAYSNGNSDIRYYNIYRNYNLNIVVKEIRLVGTDATLTTYTLANLDSPLFTGTPTAPTATLGTNTTQLATTEFVNQTVVNALTGKAAFQGSISSQSTITSLTDYKKGYHWIVQTAGTYVGQTCEVGDMIYCIADMVNDTYSANDFTVILNNLDITTITNAEIDALFT